MIDSNLITDIDVLVVGAGQAGLAAGMALRHAGLRFIVDAAEPGGSWPRDYDSLTLFHRPGSADSSSAPPHYPKTATTPRAFSIFLIMLLLPAPLLARRGRGVPTGNLRRNCSRIVRVVTAFAVGHSITLALAAFGFRQCSQPCGREHDRVVDPGLGIHAIRPLA